MSFHGDISIELRHKLQISYTFIAMFCIVYDQFWFFEFLSLTMQRLLLIRPLHQLFTEAEQGDDNARSLFTQVVQDANDGKEYAQFALAEMYAKSDAQKDQKDAVTWYRKAAEQGHTEAQYQLGLKYYEGKGVTRDYKETHRWFLLAAEKRHVEACARLAFNYLKGQGVEQNLQ